jgi:N utilization substance protein A
VAADQVSLAIGKNGQNIRLASKLTGYEINLIKEGGEDEYDIELIDFKPDLGEDLYLRLINAGLETAKDVINAKMDTLLAVEGLTEEKVHEIRAMMKKDLEEAEVDEEAEEEEEVEAPGAEKGEVAALDAAPAEPPTEETPPVTEGPEGAEKEEEVEAPGAEKAREAAPDAAPAEPPTEETPPVTEGPEEKSA